MTLTSDINYSAARAQKVVHSPHLRPRRQRWRNDPPAALTNYCPHKNSPRLPNRRICIWLARCARI